MTIRTSDGGTICASVPAAAMVPVATDWIVLVALHDRQRDEAHRDDRRGDNPGRGRQERAHEDHRKGHAAAQRAEQLADGIEQILGHARSLEDESHEREERDREQACRST